MNEAFWTIHHDLPREGPGAPEDVAWAVAEAAAEDARRVLDAGSGPGADIEALLTAMPRAHVTAVDLHADFIESVTDRFPSARVAARQSDMARVSGPFDFIWSAGAVYFLGIEAALSAFARALAPGGAVAFSHPAFFTETPSDAARAFWGGEGVEVTGIPGVAAEIAAAGFTTIAARPLGLEAWEAYYFPLAARIETLRDGASAQLQEAIAETEAEIAAWQKVKNETGYLLSVIRRA